MIKKLEKASAVESFYLQIIFVLRQVDEEIQNYVIKG